MSTEIYCTNCGDEFGPDDDVLLKSMGFISQRGLGRYIVLPSDDPYLEQLCESCNALLVEPRPNRVVVEVRSGMVQAVRAERPNKVVVIIYASTDLLLGFPRPTIFGGPGGEPIDKLNTVKEEVL